MLRKYKVIDYKVVPDPKLSEFPIFSSYYATIEETTNYIFFKRTKTFNIFKDALFWQFKDTGEFTTIAIDKVMQSYEAYHK